MGVTEKLKVNNKQEALATLETVKLKISTHYPQARSLSRIDAVIQWINKQ